MNRREFIISSAAAGLSRRLGSTSAASRIDHAALVKRHCPVLTGADIRSPLQVGNGEFAFTADVTGLQTFAGEYLKGMPLGTLSDWAWHSFPNPEHYRLSEIMRPFDSHGRKVLYADGWEGPPRSTAGARIKRAVRWLRQNPHRIDLGRIGFILRKSSGENASINDIHGVHQRLDLTNGRLESRFELEQQPVEATTICHPRHSILAVRVKSPLIPRRRLGISLDFPYASGGWSNEEDWKSTGRYRTEITQSQKSAVFDCVLDTTRYYVHTCWSAMSLWETASPHHFQLFAPGQNELDLIFFFSPERPGAELPHFEQIQTTTEQHWQEFWQSGAAIDLSASTDPRAGELERRVVLSQYLTAVNWLPTTRNYHASITNISRNDE